MNIIEFCGEVIGTETWSQTRVSGKSSGMSYGGVGVSNGRTTSTVSNVGQVWVKTDTGREVAVRVNPDKFATRGGHRVSMIVNAPKHGPAQMIAAVNHSTGAERRESAAAAFFIVPVFFVMFCWVPFVMGMLAPLLGILVGGGLLWMCGYTLIRSFQIGQAGSSFLGRTRRAARGETLPSTDTVAEPEAVRAAA